VLHDRLGLGAAVAALTVAPFTSTTPMRGPEEMLGGSPTR
jgi:hypothetical protein